MGADISEPLVVGSQDKYRLRCVDKKVDQVTGKIVEAAIDLTNYTLMKLRVAFDPGDGTGYGVAVDKTLTPDADQVNNEGYCELEWAVNDLTAGTMEARVKGTDGNGDLHWSDKFNETVVAPRATS